VSTRKLGSIGDVNPIKYGGGYVLSDDDSPEGWIEYVDGLEALADGGYYPGIRAWEIDLDNPDHLALKITVYRVPLYRLRRETTTDDDGTEVTRVMPREWYLRYLRSVASCVGSTERALVDSLCAENPCERASAYQDLAAYFGWHEFDSYPLELTLGELIERWRTLVDLEETDDE
jgi:hypothetical protein